MLAQWNKSGYLSLLFPHATDSNIAEVEQKSWKATFYTHVFWNKIIIRVALCSYTKSVHVRKGVKCSACGWNHLKWTGQGTNQLDHDTIFDATVFLYNFLYPRPNTCYF